MVSDASPSCQKLSLSINPPTGPSMITAGACGLGYQYKSIGTGWDVAAIADASPEFAGSCG